MKVLNKNDGMKAVAEWATASGITVCREIIHDVSGIPPQMTELRFELPGADAAAQVAVAQETLKRFSMPEIAEEQLSLFRALPTTVNHPLQIVLAVTEEKVIRISLFVQNPPSDMVNALMLFAQGSQDTYKAFADTLESPMPHNLLLSYTTPNMGYSMYKDGFDVMFGWDVGTEKLDS